MSSNGQLALVGESTGTPELPAKSTSSGSRTMKQVQIERTRQRRWERKATRRGGRAIERDWQNAYEDN